MSTGVTIAVSAFLTALIREWRDQENKGPINAFVYKWASFAFIALFTVTVVTMLWLLGLAAELWIWPLSIE